MKISVRDSGAEKGEGYVVVLFAEKRVVCLFLFRRVRSESNFFSFQI